MEDVDLALESIFTKPPSPPPPEPTYAQHTRPPPIRHNSGCERLTVRLVGSHPLWGHHLWNAARCFASYLDAKADDLCFGKSVLELGAGAGLPSLVAALCGARKVMLTDYPDEQLLENLKINVENNIPSEIRRGVQVQGYVWGRSIGTVLSDSDGSLEKFDLILMSDLIFNHSQHEALLQSAESCIAQSRSDADLDFASSPSKTPCVLVFYTHHRPHLAERDLEFFRKAKARGWTCEQIITERFEPMFPEDPGDENVRSSVHGWRLTWRNTQHELSSRESIA
ncbi:nicotinamide N-methyltransferase [Gautieria morchelliformis]|nr:nicotinamide N-methyltransferase [Gautieria morchelliformis]